MTAEEERDLLRARLRVLDTAAKRVHHVFIHQTQHTIEFEDAMRVLEKALYAPEERIT